MRCVVNKIVLVLGNFTQKLVRRAEVIFTAFLQKLKLFTVWRIVILNEVMIIMSSELR